MVKDGAAEALKNVKWEAQLKPGEVVESSATTGSVGVGFAEPDKCCYRGTAQVVVKCNDTGRPFIVGTGARLPALKVVSGLSTVQDSAIATSLTEYWLHAARTEYASVAAFARLTLQLLGHGAPQRLVRDAQVASLDEIRHAEACLREAHRHTDARYAFGELRVDDCLREASFESLVYLNVVEGCVGETGAALVAAEQARLATDVELSALLRAIAEDEASHSALAWRILRWALKVGGEDIRRICVEAFRVCAPLAAASAEVPVPGIDAPKGRLDDEYVGWLLRQSYFSTVLPLARELFGDPSYLVESVRA